MASYESEYLNLCEDFPDAIDGVSLREYAINEFEAAYDGYWNDKLVEVECRENGNVVVVALRGDCVAALWDVVTWFVHDHFKPSNIHGVVGKMEAAHSDDDMEGKAF